MNVWRARGVGKDMRDFVVANLQLEFVVLSKAGKVALIAIETALAQIIQVISRAEHIIEIDACAADKEVVANVAVFVQL